MIKIIQSGLLSTLQDHGRRGYRHLGIPWAGALIPAWRRIANALVDNEQNCAIVECFEGGFCLQVEDEAVRIAMVGDSNACMETENGDKLESWRSHTVQAGSTLRIRSTGNFRIAVVAFEGLVVEPHHGSCSTYAKASLGGLDGGVLKSGDLLDTSKHCSNRNLQCKPLPMNPASTESLIEFVLRAVPGPQFDAFTAGAQKEFFSQTYILSTEVDRMGARFQGTPIEHKDAASRDIISDAIVPGSVQVPGDGLPIVLLADAHTAGGYPKIATVISTDLHLLAMHRPGTRFVFSNVSPDEGVDIARDQEKTLAAHIDSITMISEAHVDIEALRSNNLIDGVTDGSPEID